MNPPDLVPTSEVAGASSSDIRSGAGGSGHITESA